MTNENRKSEDGIDVEVWQNGDGYLAIKDPEAEEIFYNHQLLAIADGADPDDVYADTSKVVHHQTEPGGQKLDVPANLEVLSRSEHRRIHVSDEDSSPHPEEVLEGS